MATTSAATRRRTTTSSRSSPSGTCGCTSPAWAHTQEREVPIIVRGEGAYVYDDHGKRYLDGLSGALLRQRRARHAELGEACRAAGARARLLHHLELRAPAGDRAGDQDRLAGARRPEPRLLHLGRLRGGRVGDQAGARLPPPTRQGPARPSSSPARSPTTGPRSGRSRPPGSPRCGPTSSPGARRLPRAEHEQLPLAGGPRSALGGRPDRGEDRVRGPRDGRGGDPRAPSERGRLHPAAGGLLPARPRDLRPLRRPADLRRGDLRVGPPGALVRLRALRLPAGHHHLGEGAHLGLRADGGDDRLRPRRRAVHGGHASRSRTASPSPATRSRRRRRWRTSTSSSARTCAATSCERRTSSARCWTRCATSRSSATCGAPASSTRSSWSRTRARRRASRTRSPRAFCAASSPASSTGAA